MLSDLSTIDLPSPLGTLRVSVSDQGLRSLYYHESTPGVCSTMPDEPFVGQSMAQFELMRLVSTQLSEYFASTREEFSIPLDMEGSVFQLAVWTKLCDIRFGFTKSYTEFARDCGDVLGVRAVASANGKNPIAIIVPCHRVIGSDGAMRGYNGGVARKQWLLKHEGVLML